MRPVDPRLHFWSAATVAAFFQRNAGNIRNVEFSKSLSGKCRGKLGYSVPNNSIAVSSFEVNRAAGRNLAICAIAAKSGWILSNVCLSKQLWQRFS